MDSLNDILLKKDFEEPSEIAAIKNYVERKYQEKVSVKVQSDKVIITAPSSSLTNTLRMQLVQLQKAANTKKILIFRTGR